MRLDDGGVPLIHGDLASLLSGLQAIVRLCIFLLRRSGGDALLRFFFVCAHLAAGASRLAGSQVVAVACVVAGGQQKISPAVVASTKETSSCVVASLAPIRSKLTLMCFLF